ncbi:MAG TPA: response regulator transcription factor [Stenomitos sp.]
MRKLLLIDDDLTMASLLKSLLAQYGFDLESVDRPSQIPAALDPGVELILLDVMLPEQDGFEVCQSLRAAGENRPIIMLTAKGDDTDRIRGLQLGADDYLPKPFNHLELVARVEAVLRRTASASAPVPASDGLDLDRRLLRLGGREVALTPTEFRLMEAFTRHPGRTYGRGELLNLLDIDAMLESYDRAIDLHISRLRSKLETDLKQPRHLVTVRGIGYRFEW